MKVGSNKRYTVGLPLIAAFLSTIVVVAYGAGELRDYDGIDGRSYHSEMHEKGRCRSCHGVQEPDGYPDDGACLRCHDVDEIIAATMPAAEDDRWQNPHDNLHYGADVPCVECHGEHYDKKPLCAGCHNFDYAKHEH